MTALRTIAEVWQDFETLLLKGAPPFVKTEMRRAFYAGYQCCISATAELGDDHVSEAEGVQFLEARMTELTEFGEAIGAGKA